MRGTSSAIVAATVGLLAFASLATDYTAALTKTRTARTGAVVLGKWHAGYSKCLSYAKQHNVPLIAVWSNGQNCGHCITFSSACVSSAFTQWMKTGGCVFFFVTGQYTDSTVGKDFTRNSTGVYPYVRVYWYVNGKKKVDVKVSGDYVDGKQRDEPGGKKAVAWFKAKLKDYKPGTAPVKPYTIKFAPNGATSTNVMPSVKAKVGTARTLPANTYVRKDYSFVGWAKSATGTVLYKNKASVLNLTTVSNGVVTLYARWKKTTFRTYYTGLKYTISMTDLKGWTPNQKVTGMTWNKSTGKWTGTPTKAGTFTLKFTKGSSTTTRKVVVVTDTVKFADEEELNRIFAEGDAIALNLSPFSRVGAAKSVKVTGLPAGLAYSAADGVISGTSTRVGTFKVTVTIVSAKDQKLTRTFNLVIGVPDCCVGTFSGFTGWEQTDPTDVLSLSNRGTFRLTAPSSANFSARIVTAKAAYAFTGVGWYINSNGTYTAEVKSSSGNDTVLFTVDPAVGVTEFYSHGVFTPSYGTEYEVWAQKSPYERDANGTYVDPLIAENVGKFVGTWYLKAYPGGANDWTLGYVGTKSAAGLILTVDDDGTAKLAGKIGSYAISASSAVFVFEEDVRRGFVRADFPVPVSVKSGTKTVKKTLDIWVNLWFDKSDSHRTDRSGGIGAAELESFQ